MSAPLSRRIIPPDGGFLLIVKNFFQRERDKILSYDLKNHRFDVIFNQEHNCLPLIL